MSPEQVSGHSGNVDTRSDVYSIGVLLYELLAGQLPLEVGTRSIIEAARLIREVEPKRLSTIDSLFHGDIATIVGKALEKDVQRRYSSAAELAADLRRHLNDEPILARPATTSYLLRKFARRHRALVLGASATGVAVVAGLIGATWFAIQAGRAQRRADAHLIIAQSNEAAAQTKIKGVIFTFVYAAEADDAELRQLVQRMKRNKSETLFVQLTCNQQELEKRVTKRDRRQYNKIRHVKNLRHMMRKYDTMKIAPFSNTISIDNTNVSPKRVARIIKQHWKL
jgi:hypothetical protein